jgi:hypothetical protein
MTTTTFNLITDWKQLPVAYIKIVINSNTYNFYKNIDSTKATIKALLEDNDTGGQTICGYEMEVTIEPAGNKMESFLSLISDLNSYQPSEVDIVCYTASTAPTVTIQSDASSITVKNWHGTWESESSTDTFFRVILKGIFSKDVVTATNPKLFTNSNM